MNRIDQIFADGRRARRGLVFPFLTGGYPTLERLGDLIAALDRAGAAAIEIGIPLSDPIADGPVIAASMHEVLQRGVTPKAIEDQVRAVTGGRASAGAGVATAAINAGLVAMVSASIVERVGVERYLDGVLGAGMHGVIVPDADIDRAGNIASACDRRGLACAFLVAPTSGEDRIKRIVAHCRGFVYLLARAGVTGDSGGSGVASGDLERQAGRIRAANASLPIAAGFGISTSEHVRAVLRHVDAAIVGTALVKRIGDAVRQGRDPVVDAEQFVRALVEGAAEGRSSAT